MNDDLYVFGGLNSLAQYNQDLWKYSISNQEWSKVHIENPSEIPVGRRHACMVAAGNDFYLFGGYNADFGILGDFYKYETLFHSFQKIEVNDIQPEARTKATMSFDGKGTIFLFGGVTDKEISNELWLYRIVNNSWTLFNGNHKPPARASTVSGFFGKYFVIFGGYNNDIGPLNVREKKNLKNINYIIGFMDV